MTKTTHNEYPKRLIEVDLPIARISIHARREKSIRHGHISTLHIWWARRPLAACRAVICASLWPDPVDLTAWAERGEVIPVGDGSVIVRPQRFLDTARERMTAWANRHLGKVSKESYSRFVAIQNGAKTLADPLDLRRALLDFIADFANWDNSTDKDYLETARALTQAAHEALGGEPETRPLVVDPFCGGGSIPLEALRVGADAFASDLNPIPVLLNKVVLEYIPKYGQRLADEVRKWGAWIKQEAEKELAEFYPKDPDGATPIAYLWARTIQCEGPGCGAEVPLINQTLISKRRGIGVQLINKEGKLIIDVLTDKPASTFREGTVRNGKVTCPICGFTMPAERYRNRAKKGELRELHYCTVLSKLDGTRRYRNALENEIQTYNSATDKLQKNLNEGFIPNEKLSATEPRRLNVLYYGFDDWGKLFNDRQKNSLLTFLLLFPRMYSEIKSNTRDNKLAEAVTTILGLAVSNFIQYNCNMATWLSDGMISIFIQSSSIPMRADYAEANPLMQKLVGGIQYQFDHTVETICTLVDHFNVIGSVSLTSATQQILPEESVDLLATDPPYYFAIPYAELSDFFYVWLKRFLNEVHPDLLASDTTPKKDEAIQNLSHSLALGQKDRAHFEQKIYESLLVGHTEVMKSGLALVVFAHASTDGWESLLKSLLSAGWIITASWPIDTEREGRMLASRQRSLASSVHLVCRPRSEENIGDWRDVLSELPKRIHDWMPRLAEEGVVGADAIFACLGPALEVFSRYSRVEKSSGEVVPLGEYLEHVWAAVSKEALSMIFKDPDTAGLEPDARLTAMWLWTLGASRSNASADDSEESEEEDSDGESGKAAKVSGFTLEFDAARKIAQGLGVHLEKSPSVVEVKGDTAKLLSVAERVKYLFGKDAETTVTGKAPRKKKQPVQQSLFAELQAAESAAQAEWGDVKGPKPGTTVLDRLHQAMVLFAAGRGEAMKRFLVEEGIGNDARFWKLAQSLTALYPGGSDEKRWVDGVLARKKGLGF